MFEETGLQFSVFKVGEGYSIPAFSPDANRVVLASGNQPARVIGISPGRQPAILHTLDDRRELVAYAEFSPDGSRILTLTKDKSARFWNAADGRPLGQATPLKEE